MKASKEDVRARRLAAQTRQQLDAQVRRVERAGRTPAEQLTQLDYRLGAGVGAVKERARLHKLLSRAEK